MESQTSPTAESFAQQGTNQPYNFTQPVGGVAWEPETYEWQSRKDRHRARRAHWREMRNQWRANSRNWRGNPEAVESFVQTAATGIRSFFGAPKQKPTKMQMVSGLLSEYQALEAENKRNKRRNQFAFLAVGGVALVKAGSLALGAGSMAPGFITIVAIIVGAKAVSRVFKFDAFEIFQRKLNAQQKQLVEPSA